MGFLCYIILYNIQYLGRQQLDDNSSLMTDCIFLKHQNLCMYRLGYRKVDQAAQEKASVISKRSKQQFQNFSFFLSKIIFFTNRVVVDHHPKLNKIFIYNHFMLLFCFQVSQTKLFFSLKDTWQRTMLFPKIDGKFVVFDVVVLLLHLPTHVSEKSNR